MSDLVTALDLLDLAIASSEGIASEAHRAAAASTAAAVRRRRDYLSDAVVVAIAGGTGSGKSSLLNAIAGRTVASTSELRPHTDEPLAWIPAGDSTIEAFVAELGIESIVEHDDAADLAIVDLPDLDSVDGRHRTLVEHVIPLVDAVVWLFDPVKYHDPSIHRDFLSGMTAYESVFVFALNKADRLDEAEREAVTAHLVGILELDGFSDPDVVTVAVAPLNGETIGVAALKASIEHRLIATRADRVKLAEDLLEAGRQLAIDAKLWSGTPDDAYGRIRAAADDPERLAATLSDIGFEGPLRVSIESADGRVDRIDSVLHRRSELGATVTMLGVECIDLAARSRKSPW